ncbi:MAG: replication initiation factor domain-containing protein [Prevotella sp.]|nr:replication initiation factor domain-containing protein [Prevotella sp.]
MLDRHSTKEAIEKLSDCLLYDMAGAEVSALEFGINTFMRKPPKVYFSMLGDLEGKQTFTRSQRGSTLYYLPNSKRGEKSLCFYDKASEHGSMAGANLLRYELRLQNGYKRLPSILGVPTLTASTLSDRSVYCAILHLWQHMYYSINKLNQLNLKEDSMNSVKTVKDGVKLYRAIMYDEKSIDAFITLLKDNGVFKGTKRGYYNKVREQLLKDVHDVTAPSDEDIKELNTVILNAGAYA